MVNLPRFIHTILSAKYIVQNEIEGDFVECGVWRGGCSLAVKMMFEAYGSSKKVFLFDTFEGMTAPTAVDIEMQTGKSAETTFIENDKGTHNSWAYASIEDVQHTFQKSGVNMNEVVFVKGDVLQSLSIVKSLPKKVAALRLDTGWYESTKYELEVLYPILSNSGVLIIVDYGHWDGSRNAFEEYFANSDFKKPLLNISDIGGRLGIKI